MSPSKIPVAALYGYSLLRAGQFAVQNLSLPLIEKLWTGKSSRLDNRDFKPRAELAFQDLARFLKEDAERIHAGVYPVEVLKPELSLRLLTKYPEMIWDAFSVSRRRSTKSTHDFGVEAQQSLEGLPEYYTRNFHFQTDGYLSERSASLYDHQVEVLFSGASMAMRRMALIPMHEKWGDSAGEGLHFLEVAAGTGSLTRMLKLKYPKAKVTLLDLSESYLKKAQDRLRNFRGLNFVQGNMAQMPFLDQHFDAVVSSFLFHELPREERQRGLAESYRVVKPGGLVVMVDSIQTGDRPEFDWALEQFPIDFHEPFYKNYVGLPMHKLFSEAGIVDLQEQTGFFAKTLWGKRPSEA